MRNWKFKPRPDGTSPAHPGPACETQPIRVEQRDHRPMGLGVCYSSAKLMYGGVNKRYSACEINIGACEKNFQACYLFVHA